MVNLNFSYSPGDWFSLGSISFHRFAEIRPFQFDPVIEDYRGRVDAGFHYMVPFGFGNGSLDAYFVHIRNIPLTHSPALNMPNGLITILIGGPPIVGALTDFAFWSIGAYDPVDNIAVKKATSLSSGVVTSGYTQHFAAVTVPEDARYIGMGGLFANVPVTTSRGQHIKKAQIERIDTNNSKNYVPTNYSKAREVRVSVRPDRLNRASNPSFFSDLSGWNFVIGGRIADARGSGGYALTGTNNLIALIDNLRVGNVYTASMYLSPEESSSSLRAAIAHPDQARVIGAPVKQAAADNTARVFVTFEALSTNVEVTLVSSVGTFTAWNLLVEDGYNVNDYFDGFFGGDYIWENEGPPGNSRSFYYKNRIERYIAIKRILADNVPMGIGVAEPIFGVLPVE